MQIPPLFYNTLTIASFRVTTTRIRFIPRHSSDSRNKLYWLQRNQCISPGVRPSFIQICETTRVTKGIKLSEVEEEVELMAVVTITDVRDKIFMTILFVLFEGTENRPAKHENIAESNP